MTPPRTVQHARKPGEVLDNSFITPGRFSELDGLRGIAALAVVAYHSGTPPVQNYPRIAPRAVLYSARRTRGAAFLHHLGVRDFVERYQKRFRPKIGISRFARLYPTYWLRLRLPRLCYFRLPGNPGGYYGGANPG